MQSPASGKYALAPSDPLSVQRRTRTGHSPESGSYGVDGGGPGRSDKWRGDWPMAPRQGAAPRWPARSTDGAYDQRPFLPGRGAPLPAPPRPLAALRGAIARRAMPGPGQRGARHLAPLPAHKLAHEPHPARPMAACPTLCLAVPKAALLLGTNRHR